MEPVQLEQKGMEYRLTHCCLRCGYTKKNKTSPDDDFEALLALSRRAARK